MKNAVGQLREKSMTKEQIETIRRLAESHDFKGVPIPQLCDLAILGALIRDYWFSEYFQPSAEMNYRARKALDEAKYKCLHDARQEERDEVERIGRRLAGVRP